MPEDYQAILSDLGVDTSQEETTPTAQDTNQSVAVDNPAPTDTQEPTTPTEEDNTGDVEDIDDTVDTGTDERNRRQNEAFAAMRSENSNYKKFIQHLMKGADFNGSEEDFMKQLSEASYAQQAKRQGSQVSPEILKRMDNIENQNRALLDERNRMAFAQNVRNLQETFNLNENEVKEFITLAAQEQIDLTVPGTNFVTLYQGLFFSKLKDKMLNEERQKWIAQNSKANSAATPDGKSGKQDPTPTDVKTMAEFESLLQSVPNKK